MTIETALIRIKAAEVAGCHPRLLFGRLVDGELHYVIASSGNMRDLFWSREHGESAEAFEVRIIADLKDWRPLTSAPVESRFKMADRALALALRASR